MLIKCPECGHQVSDQAPVCPNCGIEIASRFSGKNLKQENEIETNSEKNNIPQQPQKKQSNKVYIYALIIAVILCGIGVYFYNQTKNTAEESAYYSAINSTDPEELQNYLEEFNNAPREHRDSVQSRLTFLNQQSREWTDILVSNSRSALQQYIDKYPESPYKTQAIHKLDSIDWTSACSASTVDAIESYIDGHPNGEYLDKANDAIKDLKAHTIQPEDKLMVESIFRSFFQGINSKDEDRLTSTVNSLLSTFLGKQNATKSDVVMFMKKLWKEDVQNLNWHMLDDCQINKKEIGNGEFEFNVTFSATQDVQKASGETQNKYKIKAKVNPDGKISEMSMSKVVE